ncbi:MAG: right-handed parallel beta-helix repeat-containing protein [Deltaproteobacteria bacterium]|nr:right-handed parallel beta-helix repeat-containing protein [Deltaproteobacteria bacterium]
MNTAPCCAMFSVHDVKGVRVKNCLFQDSRVVDDMVHGVYSEMRFENCTFEGAPFDAVDLDICTAVVEDCKFRDNGNDSLDLMTSNVVVKDTLFRHSGDKGISIGEGSSLLAINVKFMENKIGVQAKDSSQCVLYNADFVNNEMAVDAYKKNWRYDGGGTVRLYKGHLYDNDSNFTADKKSRISIYDSFVDGEIKDKKRIIVDPTVDSQSRRKARVNTMWLYSEDSKSAQSPFEPYWAAVRPSIRGSYD